MMLCMMLYSKNINYKHVLYEEVDVCMYASQPKCYEVVVFLKMCSSSIRSILYDQFCTC